MVAAQDPHAELLHRFRRYLEMEEGRSPRTAKEYLMDAGLFARWFRERHGRPPRWEEAQEDGEGHAQEHVERGDPEAARVLRREELGEDGKGLEGDAEGRGVGEGGKEGQGGAA